MLMLNFVLLLFYSNSCVDGPILTVTSIGSLCVLCLSALFSLQHYRVGSFVWILCVTMDSVEILTALL